MDDPVGFAAKIGLYLTLMPLFGLPAFALTAPGGERRLSARAMMMLCGGAALLSLMQLAALAASMSGLPLTGVDRPMLGEVLSAGALGTAWQVRMIALLILVASFALPANRPRLAAQAVAAAIALASLAWFGHAAMDDGTAGWLHLGADILHLLGAGVWTGALASLSAMLWRSEAAPDDRYLASCERALAGFATTGTIVVIVLVLTGLANAWLVIGLNNLPAVPATPYGRLLIAKLTLFGAMLLLAALNRFRLTPRLANVLGSGEARGDLLAHLRRSLAIETACLIAIFFLVAWLTTLPPTGAD